MLRAALRFAVVFPLLPMAASADGFTLLLGFGMDYFPASKGFIVPPDFKGTALSGMVSFLAQPDPSTTPETFFEFGTGTALGEGANVGMFLTFSCRGCPLDFSFLGKSGDFPTFAFGDLASVPEFAPDSPPLIPIGTYPVFGPPLHDSGFVVAYDNTGPVTVGTFDCHDLGDAGRAWNYGAVWNGFAVLVHHARRLQSGAVARFGLARQRGPILWLNPEALANREHSPDIGRSHPTGSSQPSSTA